MNTFNGTVNKVENKKRRKFSNAAKEYLAVWVQDSNGDNEECLLFTQREIDVARRRAARNPEDIPHKDFVTDMLD